MTAVESRPRVWLAGDANPDPMDLPTVRDGRMCIWCPDGNGCGDYHSADGWHHATWTQLHTWFDLVEVT